MMNNRLLGIVSNLLFALLVFTAGAPVSSLLPQHTDLTHRMIVRAIGIDADGEDIHLTLAADSLTEDSEVTLVEGAGKTFYEALQQATSYATRSIFLGHTEQVLLGEAAARQTLPGFLDFMARNYQVRMNIGVLTVEDGTARDALSVPSTDGNSVLSILETLLTDLEYNSLSREISLAQVFRDMQAPNVMTKTPALRVVRDEEDKPAMLELVGYAVYDQVQLQYFFEDASARAISILEGSYTVGEETVSHEEIGDVSFGISQMETALQLDFSGPAPRVTYEIELLASISEQFWTDPEKSGLQEQDLALCQQLLEQKIGDDVRGVLAFAQREGRDITGLGDYIYRHAPYRWETLKENYAEIFPQIQMQVQVRAELKNDYVLERGS